MRGRLPSDVENCSAALAVRPDEGRRGRIRKIATIGLTSMMRHPEKCAADGGARMSAHAVARLAAAVAWCLAIAIGVVRRRAEEKVAGPKESCTFRVREQDEIWVVSTRHLGCPWGGKEEPAWQIWRYEKGWWQPRTAAEFYAGDNAEVVTPFYIHGNRIDASAGVQRRVGVYFQLVGKLDEEPPVRFVIWSWPSSQIKGPLKDVRVKAARSDVDAYYLARFLAGMKPEVRVGLVGLSATGARIVERGDASAGRRGDAWLATCTTSTIREFRVAHVGGGGAQPLVSRRGNFMTGRSAAADAWFITINCCDPVLARYRILEECGNPVAVGYAGHLWPQSVARGCERADRGSERDEHRRRDSTRWRPISIRCIFRGGRGSTSCGMTWD